MFLIKQVLPIVLLSMVIGFSFTWYNSRSEKPSSDEAGTELAKQSAQAGKEQKVSPTKQYIPKTQTPSQPVAQAQPNRTTVTKRVVQQPDTPTPVQGDSDIVKLTPKPAPVEKTVVPDRNPVIAKSTTAAPPVPATRQASQTADPDFVNDIESLISELDATTGKTEKSPAPSQKVSKAEISGWSADSFMDVMKSKKTRTISPQDEIARIISLAAKRNENLTPKDPYLNVLQDEATNLSVTAVDTSGDADIIRNLPYRSTVPDSLTVASNGPGEFFYIVKAGDSLSSIAFDVFGDSSAYVEIFNANQDVLSSPDDVSEGTRLMIPAR